MNIVSNINKTILLINTLNPMKRIACIAILALLFTNCKENNSEKEVKAVKEPVKTSPAVKKEAEKKEDCKDVEVEMGSGRECIIKGTDLAQVYQNIIKNKEVEESEYYLSAIPNESKSVPVNKNGLISIDYEIIKDKVLISMNYEGGVTEVTLEKIKDTIKKSIYHYAD
ncbi:hypothetical protein FlaCF_3001 [Flavobacterium tructae]